MQTRSSTSKRSASSYKPAHVPRQSKRAKVGREDTEEREEDKEFELEVESDSEAKDKSWEDEAEAEEEDEDKSGVEPSSDRIIFDDDDEDADEGEDADDDDESEVEDDDNDDDEPKLKSKLGPTSFALPRALRALSARTRAERRDCCQERLRFVLLELQKTAKAIPWERIRKNAAGQAYTITRAW